MYSHTNNNYCWVNKRKQNIKASIRILGTEYNERRLFARSSCQTGIQTQTNTHTIMCTYVFLCVCAYSCTGKTWARFSLYLSLPSDLSHVESLNFWLLFTCRQLVTHCVGKLVPPTSPWPSPTLCWHPLRHCFVGFSFLILSLFRMSNKPVCSSLGFSQHCRIFETRSSIMQISQLTSLFCWLIIICCHVSFGFSSRGTRTTDVYKRALEMFTISIFRSVIVIVRFSNRDTDKKTRIMFGNGLDFRRMF